jgi:hypothetical protein
MTREVVRIVAELRGYTCRCGGFKGSRLTFCTTCYLLLPSTMKRALYKRLGEGYSEAYAEATGFLDALKGSNK